MVPVLMFKGLRLSDHIGASDDLRDMAADDQPADQPVERLTARQGRCERGVPDAEERTRGGSDAKVRTRGGPKAEERTRKSGRAWVAAECRDSHLYATHERVDPLPVALNNTPRLDVRGRQRRVGTAM